MISGKYVISSNGEIIAESKNMLTTNGLSSINAYLSGQSRDWAGTISVGALNSITTTASTQTLQYEIARYPVNFKSFRNVSGSNQIVLKTTLDPAADFDIYEIGIFPAKVDVETYYDHSRISNFSELTGTNSNWLYGNNSATTASIINAAPSPRSGGYMIVIPVTNSTTTNTIALNNLNYDSTLFTENDNLQILYYCNSTTAGASVNISFGDSSNPQNIWSSSTVNLGAITSGSFYSASLAMSTKVSTLLDPMITASVTFSGTSGSVMVDHMKFVSGNTLTTDFQLTSRTISSTTASPIFSKQYSQPMDIEYYIQVT